MFNALNSACGLPFNDVWPDEITAPSLSTTQPTEGFFFVDPKFVFASSKARDKKYEFLDLKLFFRFAI